MPARSLLIAATLLVLVFSAPLADAATLGKHKSAKAAHHASPFFTAIYLPTHILWVNSQTRAYRVWTVKQDGTFVSHGLPLQINQFRGLTLLPIRISQRNSLSYVVLYSGPGGNGFVEIDQNGFVTGATFISPNSHNPAIDIAAATNGSTYILNSDTNEFEILRLDQNGNPLRSFTPANTTDRPLAIRVGPNNIVHVLLKTAMGAARIRNFPADLSGELPGPPLFSLPGWTIKRLSVDSRSNMHLLWASNADPHTMSLWDLDPNGVIVGMNTYTSPTALGPLLLSSGGVAVHSEVLWIGAGDYELWYYHLQNPFHHIYATSPWIPIDMCDPI